jgi:hypothetical protein
VQWRPCSPPLSSGAKVRRCHGAAAHQLSLDAAVMVCVQAGAQSGPGEIKAVSACLTYSVAGKVTPGPCQDFGVGPVVRSASFPELGTAASWHLMRVTAAVTCTGGTGAVSVGKSTTPLVFDATAPVMTSASAPSAVLAVRAGASAGRGGVVPSVTTTELDATTTVARVLWTVSRSAESTNRAAYLLPLSSVRVAQHGRADVRTPWIHFDALLATSGLPLYVLFFGVSNLGFVSDAVTEAVVVDVSAPLLPSPGIRFSHLSPALVSASWPS